MTPVFMSDHLTDTGYAKCVGESNKHLKLTLTQDNRQKIGGIGFNLGSKIDLVSERKLFKAAYSIDENVWQGKASIQLKLKDIKSNQS